jgi:hypothetical protein
MGKSHDFFQYNSVGHRVPYWNTCV